MLILHFSAEDRLCRLVQCFSIFRMNKRESGDVMEYYQESGLLAQSRRTGIHACEAHGMYSQRYMCTLPFSNLSICLVHRPRPTGWTRGRV